jgi:hypothetical protein
MEWCPPEFQDGIPESSLPGFGPFVTEDHTDPWGDMFSGAEFQPNYVSRLSCYTHYCVCLMLTYLGSWGIS